MAWVLVVTLVVAWMIGLVISVTFNGLLHLLLLVALAILLYQLVGDRHRA